MTREEKIKKKQERSLRRKKKRIEKDKSYANTACYNDRNSISWGRKKEHGAVFVCEMNWSECELRGYCNGDC